MAEGILAISVANALRFAKVETPADGANWENTLVCSETVPDGKRYGYAQRFITGDIIKIYFKSAYTTHVAQLYDELDATVGAAITPTTETTYATYSYFSVTLDTSAWSVTKAYHLTLVATHATYDTQTYKSEPIIALATLANHLILRYTNYDTNFEIDYSNLVVEHFIRIPARIHLYKPKGEIDVYSNQGILTKIQEIVQRVLVLECEPIPAYLCEKINVAFAHDVISVNGKEFVKESNPSVARFSKTNLYTLSVELTQTYCIGLNSDDEGFDYVGQGGDTWETVKNFPLNGVTGAQTIDVGAYRDDFRINDIVVTLLSGTGGTIKLGLTAGAEDILAETDLSGFVVGNPQSLYCGAVFGPAQDIVYITITPAAAETYDLDLTLLRYKV